MSRAGKIARRSFLIGSAAIAGGVAFGWYSYAKPYANPLAANLAKGATALTPYLLIDQAGVTVIAPRAEMGQGVHSTLAALVAEELDLPWDQVRVIHGPASHAYFNAGPFEEAVPFAPTDLGTLPEALRRVMRVPGKLLGIQLTGGSSSIPDGFDKMRAAGAAARAALIRAAALRLGVADDTLKTEGGAVVAADGTRLGYSELAAEAAQVPLPDAAPKPRRDWKLLGTSLPRTDMLAKVTGTAAYTADLRLPGMRFATVRTNPGQFAPMNGYDDSAAKVMPGVERILPLGNGVAVVATSTWAALQAAEAISFDWAAASYPATSAQMLAEVAASFTPDRQDSRMRDDGDVEQALAAGEVFEAEYTVPYLAHAAMEPLCAAAWLQDGRLQVWAGNQLPTQILAEAATITGLPAEAVQVHTTLMGGGFGRRAEMDFIKQAITLAHTLAGTPILVTWSREEDMTHDAYRPLTMGRVRATVADGMVAAMDLALACPSVIASQAGRLGYTLPGGDPTIVQGAWEQPYGFANYRVTGYRVPPGVPVGSWRSVGASQNAFFHDCAVDELAHLASVDPLLFRMRQMTHSPSIKVMEAVAEMSNWGTAPAGRAKGVGFCHSFGVPSAQVIEVENTPSGLRLTNAWAAVDVGIALDPRNIEAQVQGAMVYGLSAAIAGEITFAGGVAQQPNFWEYEPMRMAQCPPIAVRVLENGEKIRGIGEPGTPPAAPALANAIFALNGQRIRSLPLRSAIAFA